jgi:uncharacterized membrane protein
VLLVLQSCLLAAAAIPIYLLARRWTASTTLATALAAAYLLNPALQNGNLEQFHPECFLVLSVALAIYAAVEGKPVLLAVAVAASLLVKEDTALLMVPLGVWVWWRRDRSWGIAIIAASVAWMAFAYGVVIEALLGTATFYANRIPFGGADGLAAAPLVHAPTFWRYVVSGNRPFYVWQMGFSFGWGFLLAPELAAIGILGLSENVLSDFPYMQQIFYHYSLPLIPILAIGTAFAVGRLATARRRMVATALVTLAALVSCTLWGLAPFSRYTYPHMNPDGAQVAAINRALRNVPPDAVVSAYYPYVPHLDHRLQIYQWPTPFRANYWGLYKQEGQRLPVSDQVQFVVVPSFLFGEDQAVFSSIAPNFALVAEGGGVSVYRRIADP